MSPVCLTRGNHLLSRQYSPEREAQSRAYSRLGKQVAGHLHWNGLQRPQEDFWHTSSLFENFSHKVTVLYSSSIPASLAAWLLDILQCLPQGKPTPWARAFSNSIPFSNYAGVNNMILYLNVSFMYNFIRTFLGIIQGMSITINANSFPYTQKHFQWECYCKNHFNNDNFIFNLTWR